MKFDSKQKFSIRKYSFGAASVLIGTLFMGAGVVAADQVQADDASASNEAATIDLSNDVVVEEKVVTADPTALVSSQATETVASSSFDISLKSDEQVTSQAETSEVEAPATTKASAKAQVSSEASSQVASETVAPAAQAVVTAPSVSAQVAPAQTLAQAVASDIEAQTEVAETAKETVKLDTSLRLSDLSLNELLEKATNRSAGRLMNAINAAVAERNRNQRGVAGTVGFRQLGVGANGDDNYTYIDMPNPVIPGRYADSETTQAQLVDPNDPTSWDIVVDVWYRSLGKIKLVDQATGEVKETVTYANDAANPTKAAATALPSLPAGYEYVSAGTNKDAVIEEILQEGANLNVQRTNNVTATLTEQNGQLIYTPANDTVTPAHAVYAQGNNVIFYIRAIKDAVSQATSQTVTYTGAGTSTPAANVQNDYSFSGSFDQVTKETTWSEASHTYGQVNTPVVTGYYADKAQAGGLTVIPTAPDATDTVNYQALGKIILVDENGNQIPNTTTPTYNNDPQDPTKGGVTTVPTIPAGYEIQEGQNIPGFDPSGNTVTPVDPGTDTKIVLVAKITSVTVPTKQTVTFEGAGDKTPAEDLQNDYNFSGRNNQVTGQTDWNESSHIYGKVTVPVVEGFYADKSEAGGLIVTPDQPEAADKVVYKELGKIIPVDPDGTPIPNVPTPQYNNDPKDPTKGGETPVPDIPGYRPERPSVTPEDPGKDTPVIYVKVDQKATVTYLDETTGQTLEVVNLGGKSGEAVGYSTADRIKHYTDRGYELVSDGYPADATYDYDANVDQAWTVTLKHGTTPVGPEDPHEPTDPINPNDPDSPKYPSQDEWKKDVTSTVHYVSTDGKAEVPADNVQNAQWTRTLTLDKVTGQVLSATDWASNKSSYDAVDSPVITGYYVDKASVASKTVTQENLTETVTYAPLGKIIPVDPNGNEIPNVPQPQYNNDPKDPTKGGETPVPEIPGYRPEVPSVTPDKPGEDTPVIYVPILDDLTRPTKQTVTFQGAGDKTPADNVQNDFTFEGKYNQADKSTTWNENSHTYGKVDVPVIEGFYADKAEAGSKTVTPDAPEATDTVTYKELGKIIPVDPDGNPIPNVPTPTYNNDPKDPTKGGETPVPEIPGYRPERPSVTPEDPGKDTPVIYVKEDQKATVTYIDETTGQTLVVDSLTGKSGEAVGYSTADRIKYYTDRGYELVSDGYPADATYDLDASVDQAWTVTLKHGTAPVGPNDPHDPNTPINPDPEGPKWPAKDAYMKDVTSTVKYVGAGDKTPADNVQTAQWSRTLTIDKVTGQVISATDWASNKENYDAVATPVVQGYYADKASVASKTVTMENLEEVVTYKELGKLVPKSDDPNFPDTPTVPYPNDPTDPTKPGQPIVPDVPGYRPFLPDPNDPTKPGQPIEPGTPITPENPGEDTPIIYVPITPDTPDTPDTPEEPKQPEQPAKPEEPAKPAEPAAPTPQAAPVQEQAVLPQTGSEDSAVATATGLGALLAGLGLGFLGRRRKKED